MNNYQQQFIDTAIASEVLLFGEFELKSGRLSPYFFNAGKFQTGSALATLGHCYAKAIIDADVNFDVLFGPAYKGIPLVSAIAVALHQLGIDKPYAFDRKEAKTHGEGGRIVGMPIKNKKILIVDDVITAGTAIRDVMALLASEGAQAIGVAIGLDRKERGPNGRSAIADVEAEFNIPVTAIIDLNHIEQYLTGSETNNQYLDKVKQYREKYGV